MHRERMKLAVSLSGMFFSKAGTFIMHSTGGCVHRVRLGSENRQGSE
jgi:hypothetical protein